MASVCCMSTCDCKPDLERREGQWRKDRRRRRRGGASIFTFGYPQTSLVHPPSTIHPPPAELVQPQGRCRHLQEPLWFVAAMTQTDGCHLLPTSLGSSRYRYPLGPRCCRARVCNFCSHVRPIKCANPSLLTGLVSPERLLQRTVASAVWVEEPTCSLPAAVVSHFQTPRSSSCFNSTETRAR